MARKNKLSDKLDNTPRGWRDQIRGDSESKEHPDKHKSDKLVRKTLLLTEDMVKRLDQMAKAHSVGKNELARYLLNVAMLQVESGEHELPTRPVQQNTLGI